MRNVFVRIEPPLGLDREESTPVSVEDAEEVVVFGWEVVDVYAGIFHEVSPPLIVSLLTLHVNNCVVQLFVVVKQSCL